MLLKIYTFWILKKDSFAACVTQVIKSSCWCSAGIGVLNAARKTMARMLGNNETAFDSASSQFWVVDAKVSGCIYLFNNWNLIVLDKATVAFLDIEIDKRKKWGLEFYSNK